ncbi:molybdopterin molybdotransferase MoeA [Variovorax dokdonensis]|uniref:Molybdopterin molybdenumtransferase n=1 Tax=Variovorax dokdonensis TaxID=344883 RepID=A0ABT7NCI2_9BURK|nr:gephyrin-like molybdotransferase Glp [Variovorax dokdonensis]MDM0045662.1 molybdopterin molybdotransferase MoeA [Variovorax dokdonensis]
MSVPVALRVDEAQALLAQLATRSAITAHEEVPLHAALQRVLAHDLVSPFSVPPHDNSAMDGYAFSGTALQGPDAEVRLQVVGTALAGTAWHQPVRDGQAVRIMTGAKMPPGLDTVVALEQCRIDGDAVRFDARVLRPGDNRRLAGEDLRQGEPALRRGDRLGPAALGLAGSLGSARLAVFRRLRVAYFSTGDELLSLGDAPREGAIYDSNRHTVCALLRGLGCEVIDLGLVRDDPASLEATLQQAADQADAIITSGGVSVGDADHTRAVMQRLGEMAFWRIAMRPGRPMAVGSIAHGDPGRAPAALFGLPGNPVATMVSFLAFVRPALLRMMGGNEAAAAAPPLLRARSASAIAKKPGRTEYQRAWVQPRPGDLPNARLAGNQGSGVLSSMVKANGLVVLHHDQGDVAAGDEVDVMMFEGVL